MAPRRPDGLTLVAFVIVCLIGGSNFVAVRFSNRELPPFFGAGIRFVGASLLLFAIAAATKKSLPRGRSLVGASLFGVLSFFVSYALVYWGLREVPAAVAGLLFGTVPLSTFALAVLQRIERFRVRALFGAFIAIGGVTFMAGAPTGKPIAIVPLLAVALATIVAAESSIALKTFPPSHPFATNAVAMAIGGVLLLAFSALSDENWLVPQQTTTWWTLLFLVPIGSVGLFVLFVFVLQRWTASGASYQFVLFPPVSAVAAALLLEEPISASIAVGALLVIIGTYVGALASRPQAASATPRATADRSA